MLRAMMKRRDALKTIGGLGAAASMARFLPGCGSSADDGPTGITTYVYLMMENRSYDHFFGARSMLEGKAGDGLKPTMTNPNMAGAAIAPWAPTRLQLCDPDPPHGWDASHAQWNNGANDGFVTEHQREHGAAAIDPMQYLTRNEIPVSWALADKYAVADRWFCSVMGPTWPNRYYWLTGTSNGINNNKPVPGGPAWPSIFHRLDAKGVDWRCYFSNVAFASMIQGVDSNRFKRFPNEYLEDAKAGTLPPVVYIEPAFGDNDDHPPAHPINGQALIATVYKGLAASPQWKNSLMVVTYDEHGGFFDHVSPPKTVDDHAAQGFDQMGFRVPTLVAGPYVKESYVSSVVYDHCSALRELEVAFGLEPLTQRTAAAHDLSDFLDADRLQKGDWKPPIDIPAVDPSTWEMGTQCVGTSLREADNPVLSWANTHPPELAGGLDRRGEMDDYRSAIRDFLASPPPPVVK
jgi:phospholipase C